MKDQEVKLERTTLKSNKRGRPSLRLHPCVSVTKISAFFYTSIFGTITLILRSVYF